MTHIKKIIGNMNEHAVGIIMKEAVRRAISAIRSQRFTFEANAKPGYGGAMNDLVTSADNAAQAIYVKMLRECFPEYGIVAEEDDLRVPCAAADERFFFTVDPLDGTKAFGRKQSHGVGTMISLIHDEHVVAAFVGDANTQEIYGYRPYSDAAYRISAFDHAERLLIDNARPTASQNVSLHQEREMHGPLLRRLLSPATKAFNAIEIGNGSIGLGMARLWKSEIGAMVLETGSRTPWDLCPIIGISKLLGFVFLRCEERGLVPYEPTISDRAYSVDFDTLVVHRSRLDELVDALRRADA